jgi:hypothetical protein
MEKAPLPAHTPDLVVRCPKDAEGGCGSTHVHWDDEDEMYDCLDCGLGFGPAAADPPHRRKGVLIR